MWEFREEQEVTSSEIRGGGVCLEIAPQSSIKITHSVQYWHRKMEASSLVLTSASPLKPRFYSDF